MVHFHCFLTLVQVCYLTPGPKHSKAPVLDPKYHFLTYKVNVKSILLRVRIFLSHDAGDCQMTCLYSEWGILGRQKRAWATWGKPTKHPHDAQKMAIFKASIFHEACVGLGVDGPDKAAGHLQNTPRARLLLPASGSQSAL